MEHLLRDGGDLDSMDRSLIDYNQAKIAVIPPESQNGDHSSQSPTLSSLPYPLINSDNLLSPVPNASISVLPATPMTSPMSSPDGSVNVMPVIKRDLVVRFTEQQNSVRCEMAKTTASDNHKDQQTQAASTGPKEQYEVQHYSRHPHGPTSPCDSENSVCNRSRENLLGPGKAVR